MKISLNKKFTHTLKFNASLLRERGFTLIELLVVVAIVAILSGIVMASLGSSRTKAIDTAIKNDLNNIAKQAEIYYGLNGTYGTFSEATCPTVIGGGSNLFNNDSRMLGIISHANNSSGNGSSCSSTGEKYAISIGLKTVGQSLCIDDTKIVKQYTGTPAASMTNSSCN